MSGLPIQAPCALTTYAICIEIGVERPSVGWSVLCYAPSGDEAARGYAHLSPIDPDALARELKKFSTLGDAATPPQNPPDTAIEPDLVPLFALYDLFQNLGVLPERPTQASDPNFDALRKTLPTLAQDTEIYTLRHDALRRELHPWELFLALLHLFNRKGLTPFDERYEETTKKILATFGNFQCKTLGETMTRPGGEAALNALIAQAFLPRGIVIREIDAIFRHQEALGSPYCTRAIYRRCISILGGHTPPKTTHAAPPPEEAAFKIPDIRSVYRRGKKTMHRLNSSPYSRMCQMAIALSNIVALLGPPARIHIRSFTHRLPSPKIRPQKKPSKGKTAREKHLLALHARVREKYLYIHDSLSKTAKVKLALHEEQNGICPYSMQPIDEIRLVGDRTYADIDHILPLSRSGDNSYENKILALTEKNREKRNRTPHEYFGDDDERWAEYERWVRATIADPIKRDNLLCVIRGEVDDENRLVVENFTHWLAAWLPRLPNLETTPEITTEFASGRLATATTSLIQLAQKTHLDRTTFAAALKQLVPRLSTPPPAPRCATPPGASRAPARHVCVYVKDGRHYPALDFTHTKTGEERRVHYAPLKERGRGKEKSGPSWLPIDRSFTLHYVLTPHAEIFVTKTDGTTLSGKFAGIDATRESLRVETPDGSRRSIASGKIRSIGVGDAPYVGKIQKLFGC